MTLRSFSFGLIAMSLAAGAYTACSSTTNSGAAGGGGAAATNDDAATPATGGNSAGGGGAAATGGGGGGGVAAGGGGGTGGAPATGNVTGSVDATCGARTCGYAKQLAMYAKADGCCISTTNEVCGIAIAGGACVEAAAVGKVDALDSDPTMVNASGCPNRPNPYYTLISLPGCCRPDNTCGLFDTFVGLGCSLSFNSKVADGGTPSCNYATAGGKETGGQPKSKLPNGGLPSADGGTSDGSTSDAAHE